MSDFPPCGLYRTRTELAGVPQGRLVYFHDHGDPGPGIYLPASWNQNKARFSGHGHVLTAAQAQSLEPLQPEGFYCVIESFSCCEKNCRTFAPGELVQLGYDGNANPILFSPQWKETGFSIPESGLRAEGTALSRLSPLKVAGTEAGQRRGLH